MRCSSKVLNPRRGLWEPPIYSRLFRTQLTTCNLQLASKVCVGASVFWD